MFAWIASTVFLIFGIWLCYESWREHNGKMAVVGLLVFLLGAIGASTV